MLYQEMDIVTRRKKLQGISVHSVLTCKEKSQGYLNYHLYVTTLLYIIVFAFAYTKITLHACVRPALNQGRRLQYSLHM